MLDALFRAHLGDADGVRPRAVLRRADDSRDGRRRHVVRLPHAQRIGCCRGCRPRSSGSELQRRRARGSRADRPGVGAVLLSVGRPRHLHRRHRAAAGRTGYSRGVQHRAARAPTSAADGRFELPRLDTRDLPPHTSGDVRGAAVPAPEDERRMSAGGRDREFEAYLRARDAVLRMKQAAHARTARWIRAPTGARSSRTSTT